MLTAQGYSVTEKPETADVILLNTCSVREHAEERAVGKMFELCELKQEKPDLVLGIIGCMAKLQQEKLFKRLPKIDLVAGPAELYDLPYLLAEIQEKRQQMMAVARPVRPLEMKQHDFHRPGVTAFVTIMEGCDKACAYCIVPMTRGREVSRPAQDILAEINRLVDAGYQEVTLLGQNVNSYGKRFPDGTGYQGPLGRMRLLEEEPESLFDFPKLLRLIDSRTGIKRVRFTTSHPIDATDRLFAAMEECESVCESLHLPVQSGSNRILRMMKRGYTVEAYQKKIEALRVRVPDISLSTDIIIGFPGETDDDFEATVRLMEAVRFDQAYIFKYSPRPGTSAAAKEDDVAKEIKEARNQRLLALQEGIGLRRHQALEGSQAEILVEGQGRLERQWFGKSRGNHAVIVESPDNLLGQLVPVRVTRGTAHTVFGEIACIGSSPLSVQPQWGSPPSR